MQSSVVMPSFRLDTRVYPWQFAGWEPALGFKISKVRSNIYKLVIAHRVVVFFKSSKQHLHRPPPAFAHFKSEREGVMRVSLYSVKDGAREFLAYQSLRMALSTRQNSGTGPSHSLNQTARRRRWRAVRSRPVILVR